MSGATSFGAYKVVHYLGGVDNWLFQRVDNSIAVSPNQNYTYQAFAGPLRGFYVNSRNGNNFVVSNTELRLPLFRYLANKPLQSEFTDNFQIIGFFDIGSAWSGRDPYDDENDFNLISSTQKPVTVEIRSNREPIIYGYGFGLRSKVLGYYMRADWAWGVDDHQVMPRVFYLSLNMDF
jgi:outer membrane protein assembly factor BamA